MSAPSVSRLVEDLGIDGETAATVRALMEGHRDPRDFDNADLAHLESYTPHNWEHLALIAIDEVLEMYGVEGFTLPDGYSHGVSYCNTGDAYATTVCLITDSQGVRWHLGSYGDLVELFPCAS